MDIIATMRERVDRLASCAGLQVESVFLPASAANLSDREVVELLGEVSALAHDAGRLQSVLAGVAAQRSRRVDGHSGLAATQGHSSPVSLVQAITGGTKADAARHVRVGESLIEGADEGPDAVGPGASPAPRATWHADLRRALLDGRLTSAQQDAIRRGLGEPPAKDGVAPEAVEQAWSLAAEGLIAEASTLPVEELGKRSRIVRDMLDPVGAEERFTRRFENRGFSMWIDAEGQHRASVVFDDEMALWVRGILDAALRPRRGGPRFMTDEERSAADELIHDSRTNKQLEYDLLMDVLRAGALASADDVFGARQPGVRMIVVKDAVGPRDAFGRHLAVGHAEDGGDALPGSVIDRAVCATGWRDMTIDSHGNPLDLGREQRLYSAKQRVTLAARDGGCLWPGCHRPPSYCEAHHCDHYSEGGRTDIDRGLLLCRFHHLLLHSRGWRVTRDGLGPFLLHPPPDETQTRGTPIELRSKAAWAWAWDPPPAPRAGWRTQLSA